MRPARASDPALVRGLTQPRISRRRLLKGAAAAGIGVGAGSLLSACGIAGTRDTGWEAGFDWKRWWAEQQQAGVLDFANWPLYIDRAHGTHPSLDMFEKQTGITVNYKSVIQENATFFAQISPVLRPSRGSATTSSSSPTAGS